MCQVSKQYALFWTNPTSFNKEVVNEFISTLGFFWVYFYYTNALVFLYFQGELK